MIHTFIERAASIRRLLFLTAGFFCVSLSAQTAYDVKNMQREKLDRGVVALRTSEEQVLVSWRFLESDADDVCFEVLRDGKKIAQTGAHQSTMYLDNNDGKQDHTYTVRPVKGKKNQSGEWTVKAGSPIGYLNIPIDRPADELDINGDTVRYTANDVAMADLDGDGKMEIVLKWDPSNSKDNSQSGMTNNTYIDAYRITDGSKGLKGLKGLKGSKSQEGSRLWRINMGRNIRSGAHYTQMMLYDFDGDGKAELIMKTADGTIDGMGKVIGDSTADHREMVEVRNTRYYRPNANHHENYHTDRKGRRGGFISRGPEYLTVFEGMTGKALYTTDYVPERGDLKSWGDNYANRSERYLACVAYLDGKHPSAVMCRGYYARTSLVAWDWDGKTLKQRWYFDSSRPGLEAWGGQGFHNLRVADIDQDGKDEIIYGSMALDHDGTGLYNTGLGHGDAMHVCPMLPLSDRLYFFGGHEDQKSTEFRDAQSGKTLWKLDANGDVGRALCADINPKNPGYEMWTSHSGGIRNYKGELIDSTAKVSINFAIWWDGDLCRELLDKCRVTKYSLKRDKMDVLLDMKGVYFNNGTKSNPSLCCDILGDWREEVLCADKDSKNLRLYVSPERTMYRFHTFLQDHIYRMTVAHQNTCYNQPTNPGFYFGAELQGSGRKLRGWQF